MSAKLSDIYEVRRGDLVADREHILGMWSQITSNAAPDDKKLDWFYRGNPAGEGTISLLWHLPADKVVGITCAGRRTFVAGNKTLNAAVCGDLVIDREHRSLGPSLLLHKETTRRLLSEYDFYYAFPNFKAATVRMLGSAIAKRNYANLVLPLEVSNYLARYVNDRAARVLAAPLQVGLNLFHKFRSRGRHARLVESEASANFLDSLWQKKRAQAPFMGERDATFLDWRLGEHPGSTFRYFAVKSPSGEPEGYVAYEINEELKAKVADFLVCSEEKFEAVIIQFIEMLRSSGILSVTIRQNVHDETRYNFFRHLGFVEAKMSQLFLASNNEEFGRMLADRSYFNTIDSDV